MLHFISVVFVGMVAGWLSGQIMKGRGFGMLGNLIVGILGSVVGSIIFDAVGLSAYHIIGKIICATVGAVALLFGMRVISKA